jgi:hypothetical protein
MRILLLHGLTLAVLAVWPASAAGTPQLRVSPGPLARAHAELEGVTNCGQCHDPTHALSAERCLKCHKPIAQRIADKRGVHRAVTGDCRKCHAEHAGADADLRRIDAQNFNHAVETGFAFDGLHAKVATTCAACHKKRTFLDARRACSACHADVHKGTLGPDCTRCHSTTTAFKQTRTQFDHARTRFQLTGAHRSVACEKCHVAGAFRGLHFEACSDCHKVPHRTALGPSCTSCHVTDQWKTREFDHAKSGFLLAGAHVQVACAKCHVTGIQTALPHDRCSSCHANVHRESVKEDCRACHTETGFRGAKFDHRLKTGFPLAGKHEGLACQKCHTGISGETVPAARKVLDYRGLKPDCASCHKDQHKGEYGRACEGCHQPATFKAAGFTHPRAPEFYAGRHAGVACARCHVPAGDLPAGRTGLRVLPAGSKTPSTACAGCHPDVHLGQLGAACERCHAIDAAKFAPARFSHESGAFPLTGRHRTTDCVKCHPSETGTFPSGTGTSRRVKPVSAQCRSCHKDPHMGQVDPRCETCHVTTWFKILTYRHPGLENLFGVANHDALPCRSCHKMETGQFPAGQGTAMRLKVGRTCVECHP